MNYCIGGSYVNNTLVLVSKTGHLKVLLCLPLILVAIGCASDRLARGVPIRVALAKGEVQEVPLEKYLMGVLEKETIRSWPLEALKAQAVASRTYALYRKEHPRNENYDLRSDVSDQVFEKRGHYASEIQEAVFATEGEVLKYEGELFSAFFHSCCGGMSERGDAVWEGVEDPPLQSVRTDPYCSDCPRDHWEYQTTKEDLASLLTKKGDPLPEEWEIEVTERDDSGRVTQISFHPPNSRKELLSIRGTDFREIVGTENLRSTLFEVIPPTHPEDPLIFSGRGSGHGVGLCQWGAKGMADEGKNYREILEFYYPGSEISSITSSSEAAPETIKIDEE